MGKLYAFNEKTIEVSQCNIAIMNLKYSKTPNYYFVHCLNR